MKPIVHARYVGPDAEDAQIRGALWEMLDGLDGLASSLGTMRSIVIKSNLGILDARTHRGRPCALADAAVVEAVVAWLRRHTDAEIVVGDASTGIRCEAVAEAIGLPERLAPHRARIVDFNDGPFQTYAVPGGGVMFDEYVLSDWFARADLVVSIAKMKAHLSTGVTLTLKNLFGIPPTSVYGAPRRYLHAPVRLPRVIVDLGLILRPQLCVIDGVIGQTRSEWHGPGVDAGWLFVGDNCVATDAVAMRVMGIRPLDDYPEPPFHFDRNPIRIAYDRGLGSARLEEIELRGDPLRPVHGFYADKHMEPELLDEIRRSIAEQAALFLERREEYLREFSGQFIGLFDGEVIQVGETLEGLKSRGQYAKERGKRNKGLYLKRVVPEPEDREVYAVYREILDGVRA
ncbi:MAG: hypothetical protein KatS3mg115_0090 [Candidatus Poribacteria bacterium]|nr:MAG: hypothetical protein KatS3mg115_0090 [Candidatus Poribacteria bacterium]